MKRKITILLTLVFLLSLLPANLALATNNDGTLPSNSTVPSTICGDINLDGIVDETDIEILMQYFAKMVELSEQALINADVNGDGRVNTVDVTILMQYLSDNFPEVNTLPYSRSVSAITLTLNTPANVQITSGGRQEVRFTAPSAGTYIFESSNRGTLDPTAYTALTGGTVIDDDSGTDLLNYRFQRTLAANETIVYYSGVFANNSTANGSHTVTVTRAADTQVNDWSPIAHVPIISVG